MSKHQLYSSSTRIAATVLMAASVLTAACSKKSEEAPASAPAAAPATESSAVAPTPTTSTPAPDDATVLAVVNGTQITLGEFNKEMDVMVTRMQGRVPPERLGQMRMQMREQLLDNMIVRQVLMDEVKAQGIVVTDEDFSDAVTQITESMPPGMTLNDMLAQAETTEEEFKTTLTKELQIRKLLDANTDTNAVASAEEVEAFYTENQAQFEQEESVEASHILIGFEETDTDEQKAAKRQQLEDIKKQLGEGADFAALAGEHSTCPSKAQGGSLGNFTKGRMVPEFEAAAFTQEIDVVGDIVETQFGYHLIKVTAKNPAGVTPLDEVRERLTDYLSNQKRQKIVQEYVEGLREKSTIETPSAE